MLYRAKKLNIINTTTNKNKKEVFFFCASYTH